MDDRLLSNLKGGVHLLLLELVGTANIVLDLLLSNYYAILLLFGQEVLHRVHDVSFADRVVGDAMAADVVVDVGHGRNSDNDHTMVDEVCLVPGLRQQGRCDERVDDMFPVRDLRLPGRCDERLDDIMRLLILISTVS